MYKPLCQVQGQNEKDSVCSQGVQLCCDKDGFTIRKDVWRPKYCYACTLLGGGVGGWRQGKVDFERDVSLGSE